MKTARFHLNLHIIWGKVSIVKSNRGIALALAAVLITSGGGWSASVVTAVPARAAASQSEVDTAVETILNLSNIERLKEGLAPLTLSKNTNTVAQKWSANMADLQYMRHNPLYDKQMPAGWWSVGENVAWGSQGHTPTQIFNEWMNSPGHRANILGDFTHIGIGWEATSNGAVYSTQNFGKYATAPPSMTAIPNFVLTETSLYAYWSRIGDVQEYTAELYLDNTLVETQSSIRNDVRFSGLKQGTEYTLKVTATVFTPDSRLNSPVRTQTATTLTPPPPMLPAAAPNAPGNIRASNHTDETAKISWTRPVGIVGELDGYEILVKTAGQADMRRFELGDSTSVSLSNLTGNTAYSAEVRARVISSDYTSKALSPAARVSFKTPGGVVDPPAINTGLASVKAPTGLKNSVAYNHLTASWTAPKGTVGKLSGYTATLKLGAKTVKTATTTATSHKFIGLAPSTGYTVEVKANAISLNGARKASSPVATARATTAKSPLVKVSAPVIATSKLGYDRVSVSWKKPAATGSITSYRLLVKQGTKVAKTYNVKPSVLSQAVTGLKEKTKYVVVVEAYAKSQDGKKSAKNTGSKAITMATSPASTVKVAAPIHFTVSSETTSINSSWKKPAVTGKVASYTVTLKHGTKTVKAYTTSGLSRSFKGLKRKTTYDVHVKANAVSTNGKYKSSSVTLRKSIRTK